MDDNTVRSMPTPPISSIDMGQRPLDQLPLGMAYVPMQKWEKLYESELGLNRGTIFSQLDLPWIGEEVK